MVVFVLCSLLMLLGFLWLRSQSPDQGKYSQFKDTNWREGAQNFHMPTGNFGEDSLKGRKISEATYDHDPPSYDPPYAGGD